MRNLFNIGDPGAGQMVSHFINNRNPLPESGVDFRPQFNAQQMLYRRILDEDAKDSSGGGVNMGPRWWWNKSPEEKRRLRQEAQEFKKNNPQLYPKTKQELLQEKQEAVAKEKERIKQMEELRARSAQHTEMMIRHAENPPQTPEEVERMRQEIISAQHQDSAPATIPAGSAIPGKPGAVADGKGGFSYPAGPQQTPARISTPAPQSQASAQPQDPAFLNLPVPRMASTPAPSSASGLEFRNIDGQIKVTGRKPETKKPEPAKSGMQ